MSRRCGISIPCSSLANEICFSISGMAHPRRRKEAPPRLCWSAKTGSEQNCFSCKATMTVSIAWVVKVAGRRARGRESRDLDPSSPYARLLHFHARSLLLELGLDLGGFVLRHAGLHDVRGTVDQILCFLETQASDLANHLDDLDLLGTRFLEGDVELGLLFHWSSGCAARPTAGRCAAADWRRRNRNVELRLEGFDQLGELEDRHVADRIENLVLAHGRISHCVLSFVMNSTRGRRYRSLFRPAVGGSSSAALARRSHLPFASGAHRARPRTCTASRSARPRRRPSATSSQRPDRRAPAHARAALPTASPALRRVAFPRAARPSPQASSRTPSRSPRAPWRRRSDPSRSRPPWGRADAAPRGRSR